MILNGQCCGDGFNVVDLLAASEVFRRAADALVNGEHGEVICRDDDMILASVMIDRGGDHPLTEEGLPLLARVTRKNFLATSLLLDRRREQLYNDLADAVIEVLKRHGIERERSSLTHLMPDVTQLLVE